MNINIQSNIIRYFAIFCACIVLIMSFFAIPAFAASDESENQYSFSDQAQPYSIGMGSYNTLPVIGSTSLGDGDLKVWSRYHTIQTYMFQYLNSNGTPVIVYCNAKSNYSPSGDEVRYYPGSNNYIGSQNFSVYSNVLGNSDYWYCTYTGYGQGGSWGTYTLDLPLYPSLNDGLQNFLDYMGDGGFTVLNPDAPIAITLKPGYVGYFDITDLNVEVTLGTSLFSGAKYSGYSTNQAIGLASSLPSGSFTLPVSGTSPINWSGSSQQNLIGQYTSFSYKFPYSGTGSHHYLCIVNPLSGPAPVLSALGASASNRNGNITVLINHCRGSKIYSLTESLDIGSGSLDTNSDGDSVNDGLFNPDDGSWEFTNPYTGNAERPDQLPTGGGNDPLIGGNSGNTINDFLQDIADTIKGFFTGAIGAVTTLVGAGSSFFRALIGLYSWLPSPVLSVLTSAMILVITIGVIKVFI